MDNQNLTSSSSTGSQLSGTRDPQAVGGATQAASTNAVQNSTSSALNGTEGTKISSVGSATFAPVDTTNTTTIQPAIAQKPVNHHYPVIFGGSLLILVIIFATWLMTRNAKPY